MENKTLVPRKNEIVRITQFSLSSQRGFTLIELLISVLLLSLMLTLASVAMRNLLMSWDRLSTPYPQKAISFYRLQSVVHGLFPYVVSKEPKSVHGIIAEPGFFFKGEKNQCTFISLSPLKTDEPSICHIYKKGNQIVLVENLLYSPVNDFMVPAIHDYSEPVVLFEGISELSFFYEYKMNEGLDEWYAFPAIITMIMKNNENEIIKNVFVIKSNFYEKVRLILLLQDSV